MWVNVEKVEDIIKNNICYRLSCPDKGSPMSPCMYIIIMLTKHFTHNTRSNNGGKKHVSSTQIACYAEYGISIYETYSIGKKR